MNYTGLWRWGGVFPLPPCGYCLEASMTVRGAVNDGEGLVVLSCCYPTLWILP